MPTRKGKSASPSKKKEKEATIGVETSSDVEEDHDSNPLSSRVDENPNDFFESLPPPMGKIGEIIYGISGSTSYTKGFLGLAGQVQNDGDLDTVYGALEVMEVMIQKERMSKDEFCKAMPILPTSDEEKPADQAAKFSSEIEKLQKQLTANEMSPDAIADIFSQEDGSSLLKGGLRSIAGKRAFEELFSANFKDTAFESAENLYLSINGLLKRHNVQIFSGDSLNSTGSSPSGITFRPPSHGESDKKRVMSISPLASETLSPELKQIPNGVGSYSKEEYEAMYAVSTLLALPLSNGSAHFTEDAKLLACKMEVFQRALFSLVGKVAELVVAHTDKRDSWASVFGRRYLVTTSVISKAADLFFPVTPVSIGLGFRHPDLHVGARAYFMLLDECSQNTVNNGSQAIANLWDVKFNAHENLVSFVLRVQGHRDAVQEQARLPAGCKEQGHPAATDACVNQIIVEAVVKCARENSESFATQELEATRQLENKYYTGCFSLLSDLLEFAEFLDKQGLFKGSSSLHGPPDQSHAYMGSRGSGNQQEVLGARPMSREKYKLHLNVLGDALPAALFRECMERIEIAGEATWRFKANSPKIPEEFFKGAVSAAILGLKSARRSKRANGLPNPEFNEAVYNAPVLPFEPFQPHKLSKLKGSSGKGGKTDKTGKRGKGGQAAAEEDRMTKQQAQMAKEKQKQAKDAHHKAQKEARDKERIKQHSELVQSIVNEVSSSVKSTMDSLSKELKEVKETQKRYEQSRSFMSLQVDGDEGGDDDDNASK